MAIYARCPDCTWQAEADDHRDAERAGLNHWEAVHAPEWCGFCDRVGPESLRRDHPECLEQAERDATEGYLAAEGWLL